MVVSLAKPKSVSFKTVLGLLEVYKRFSGCKDTTKSSKQSDKSSIALHPAQMGPRAERGFCFIAEGLHVNTPLGANQV